VLLATVRGLALLSLELLGVELLGIEFLRAFLRLVRLLLMNLSVELLWRFLGYLSFRVGEDIDVGAFSIFFEIILFLELMALVN